MVCVVVASMSPHVAGREGSEQGGTVGTKGTLATVVRWDGGAVGRWYGGADCHATNSTRCLCTADRKSFYGLPWSRHSFGENTPAYVTTQHGCFLTANSTLNLE
eukprot:scaffold1402_cov254-Pinguiococcus_pyrenoidosus.AAC.18